MVDWVLSNSFINSTGSTATIVKGLFDNVGGSWFTTIMLIMMFIILIAIVLRIPIELTALFIIPMFIACYVYVPDFKAITGVLLLYIGLIIGKYWFLNK